MEGISDKDDGCEHFHPERTGTARWVIYHKKQKNPASSWNESGRESTLGLFISTMDLTVIHDKKVTNRRRNEGKRRVYKDKNQSLVKTFYEKYFKIINISGRLKQRTNDEKIGFSKE